MNRIELEERLIEFAKEITSFCRKKNITVYNQHLIKQILRSSSSAALNYGEAQSAESRRDFIHKIRICLKELKETQVCSKLLFSSEDERYDKLLQENNELIRIFNKTLVTINKSKK